MSEFQIYLLTRLDYVQNFLLAISIIILAAVAAWWFYYGMEHEWDDEIKQPPKKYVIIAITLMFTSFLIPTKSEMIVILAGAKAFKYIEQDKNLQKIPGQAAEIFSKYLDSKINELDSAAKK